MAALWSALAFEQGHTVESLPLTRRRAVNLFILIVFLSNLVVFIPGAKIEPPLVWSVTTDAVLLTVFFSIGLLLRKPLLRSAFHRRICIWCAGALTERLVLMLFAIFFGMSFRMYECLDFIVMAGAFALVSFLGLPDLFWGPPGFLLAAGFIARLSDATIPYVPWISPAAASAIAVAWSTATDRA